MIQGTYISPTKHGLWVGEVRQRIGPSSGLNGPFTYDVTLERVGNPLETLRLDSQTINSRPFIDVVVEAAAAESPVDVYVSKFGKVWIRAWTEKIRFSLVCEETP